MQFFNFSGLTIRQLTSAKSNEKPYHQWRHVSDTLDLLLTVTIPAPSLSVIRRLIAGRRLQVWGKGGLLAQVGISAIGGGGVWRGVVGGGGIGRRVRRVFIGRLLGIGRDGDVVTTATETTEGEVGQNSLQNKTN